ncbi:Malate-2H(+)/Na(+)-lactate antiporter [Moraxella caviae]|uniref:Na+/H+ antiporter NhaC family protein n=1 Tax=Moraxella caviae TaxID=34060 RepID=UPI00101B3E58|nr:Na+/H+ antiporter NhaC family protein [Moraxella caviae]VEW11439.1 Malate-2H(+)/Na(+)-lactate antiporter [Moraxella caviae]
MIGLTIGSWIGGGVIATMIYYGLQIISPSLFLITICLICAIVTVAIGSSWSTMGTLGVAGMGIGLSLDIPPAMIAGAVVSGAYFGDKLSPLSDTTNLAAGITNTDLFEHIKNMLATTLPAFIIAMVAYFVIGQQFGAQGSDLSKIEEILTSIDKNFVISPWLLLVPLAVIILVVKKVPALPALTAGIALGFLCQRLCTGGDMATAVNTLHDGYSIESGHEMIDTLFTAAA